MHIISEYIIMLLSTTVGEDIIATIKKRNNFCYPSKMVINPHLVIALNLVASIFV